MTRRAICASVAKARAVSVPRLKFSPTASLTINGAKGDIAPLTAGRPVSVFAGGRPSSLRELPTCFPQTRGSAVANPKTLSRARASETPPYPRRDAYSLTRCQRNEDPYPLVEVSETVSVSPTKSSLTYRERSAGAGGTFGGLAGGT